MNLDNLSVIDKTTGEEVAGKLLFLPPKAKCGKFVMLFQERLPEIAKNPNIKGTDFRLLFLLMHYTAFENDVQITAALLAAELETTRSNIYASFTRLREANIIEKHPVLPIWRFAFTFLWKGKVKTLNEARTARFRNVSKPTTTEEQFA